MYMIEKSNDAALPWRVVWKSGSFVRPKGRYSTESEAKARARQLRANMNRKAKNQAMRDLGLYKVRGVLGGTYWE